MTATFMQNLMKRVLSDKTARNTEVVQSLVVKADAEFNPWADGAS